MNAVGKIHPAKTMFFLRRSVGHASGPKGRYEMSMNTDGSPLIQCEDTGKFWSIEWDELIELARQAGVSAT